MVLTAVAHVVLLKRCRFEETEFKSQQQVWMVKKKQKTQNVLLWHEVFRPNTLTGTEVRVRPPVVGRGTAADWL